MVNIISINIYLIRQIGIFILKKKKIIYIRFLNQFYFFFFFNKINKTALFLYICILVSLISFVVIKLTFIVVLLQFLYF